MDHINKQINIGQYGTGSIQNNTFNFDTQGKNVPIPSNVRPGSKNFVGREKELENIHNKLTEEQGVIVCAVEGLGGVGKTELALQYAQRYREEYTAQYWLNLREMGLAQAVVTLAAPYISLPESMQAASIEAQAAFYEAMGRYSDAEPLYLRTLEIWTESLGENHPNTQTAWGNFRYLLQQALANGSTDSLSPHPLTQQLLQQMRE